MLLRVVMMVVEVMVVEVMVMVRSNPISACIEHETAQAVGNVDLIKMVVTQ